jgi:hypothetical protein
VRVRQYGINQHHAARFVAARAKGASLSLTFACGRPWGEREKERQSEQGAHDARPIRGDDDDDLDADEHEHEHEHDDDEVFRRSAFKKLCPRGRTASQGTARRSRKWCAARRPRKGGKTDQGSGPRLDTVDGCAPPCMPRIGLCREPRARERVDLPLSGRAGQLAGLSGSQGAYD